MRIKKAAFICLCTALMAALSFSSCKSTETEAGWTGTYRDSKSGWILEVRQKNQAVLILPYPSRTEIHGEAFADQPGHWTFHTDELHLFYNWYNGWTETVLSLQGMLQLSESDGWVLSVTEEPQIGSVLEAEIRYKRDKLYGDRARDLMSRRLARTQAVADFVRSRLDMENYSFDHKKKGYYSKEFEKDLKSLLFPEVYGFSDSFPRPRSDLDKKERYTRNEEILWDSVYTTEYFPGELEEIRDSGTLFRDFEEASELIMIICSWQDLWESILPRSDIQEY